MVFKSCYRRDSIDKTHHVTFTQMEYREKVKKQSYPNLVDQNTLLVNKLTDICNLLELDLSRIEFRPTRYSYVAPAIQVFYKCDKKQMQLFGAGLLTDNVLKKNHPYYDPCSLYIAAGIGLQRVYMAKYKILSIQQCYNA